MDTAGPSPRLASSSQAPEIAAPQSRWTARLLPILQASLVARRPNATQYQDITSWKWTFTATSKKRGESKVVVLYTTSPGYLQTENCDKYLHQYTCHALEVDVPCGKEERGSFKGHKRVLHLEKIDRLKDGHMEVVNMPVEEGEKCPLCVLVELDVGRMGGMLEDAESRHGGLNLGLSGFGGGKKETTMGDGQRQGMSALVEGQKETLTGTSKSREDEERLKLVRLLRARRRRRWRRILTLEVLIWT